MIRKLIFFLTQVQSYIFLKSYIEEIFSFLIWYVYVEWTNGMAGAVSLTVPGTVLRMDSSDTDRWGTNSFNLVRTSSLN